MIKMLVVSRGCKECVFYQKKCVLGHRRPWNSLACDDYRPYCLVCSYPEMFCNTCRNLASKSMKPLRIELKMNMNRIETTEFECVWEPPVVRQF